MAEEFRETWPNTHQQLIKVKQSLEDLRLRVAQINTDIMTAGGNV